MTASAPLQLGMPAVHRRPGLSLLGLAVCAVLTVVLTAVSTAQDAQGEGRFLFGGVVRPGMPAPIHAPDGRAWRGRWGLWQVDVEGSGAVVLPWPERGGARLEGPGAPEPDAFRTALLSEVLVGVLPEAARRWSRDSMRAAREQEALEQALGRRARFVPIEEALGEVPAPALSGVDLVVARDRTELDRRAAVREWVGLGGSAVVLEGEPGGALGLGCVVAASVPGAPLDLARVAAEPVPAQPMPPPARSGPVRIWAGLVSLLFLAAVGWRRGRRIRGWIPAAVVGAGIVAAFPASAWTLRSHQEIWCFPGEGGRAWVHAAHRVIPRGRGEAHVAFETAGLVLTAVPPGASIVGRRGLVRVSWRGAGQVAGLDARRLGDGFFVRRAGGRTLVAARLPAGFALTDAHFLRPGELRRLGTLRAGSPAVVEDAPLVAPDQVPRYVRSLLRGLVRRPPETGLVFGVLEGRGLTGHPLACAVPSDPAP